MRCKTIVRVALVTTLALSLGGIALADKDRSDARETRQDRQERRDDRRDVGRLERLQDTYAEAIENENLGQQKSVEIRVLQYAGVEVKEGKVEAKRDRKELRRSRRDPSESAGDDRRDLRKTLRANEAFKKAATEFNMLKGKSDRASLARKQALLLGEMVEMERRELRRDRREIREERTE